MATHADKRIHVDSMRHVLLMLRAMLTFGRKVLHKMKRSSFVELAQLNVMLVTIRQPLVHVDDLHIVQIHIVGPILRALSFVMMSDPQEWISYFQSTPRRLADTLFVFERSDFYEVVEAVLTADFVDLAEGEEMGGGEDLRRAHGMDRRLIFVDELVHTELAIVILNVCYLVFFDEERETMTACMQRVQQLRGEGVEADFHLEARRIADLLENHLRFTLNP
mmetsp:Transcript_74846/g.119066  ORF Transcript_74846/g.119066 Transcript_74846/m.119066 type:complete len:221 (-) Transcript_74846:125-787(-)|eukprot:CAMPEP_0197022222 /NCGR_PEP_ID=MMETSP1384-20130603/3129_1 /TAXON_ID=29189 /ORGANISM="Ammonia sp." /LENGTH=220 /DNA_ID=CAMNT_0042450223 /DNA_START=285 /DNA_END=947 /DNA_ORIENTATION=+